jgi:hypothetical protein
MGRYSQWTATARLERSGHGLRVYGHRTGDISWIAIIFFTEVSPRVPTFWRTCFTESFPSVLVPMPVLHANSRVNTTWLSVPEGYGIPGVQDVPRY